MADPVQLAHLTPAPGSVTRPSAPPPVPPKPKHQQEPDRAFEAAPFRLRITHRLSNVDKADWVVDESDEPPAVLAAIDASLADDPPAAAAPPETLLHQPARPTDQPGADPSALTSADTVRVSETMAIDEVERQFDDGIAAIAAGDGAEGERLLSEVLVADPDHVPARETLAAYLAREGRLARAAALLVEGRQRQPQERRLAKLYARILVEQGQVQESLSVLAEAAPAIQVDPEYHALRAALLQRVDQHLDAAAVFSQVVRLRPGEARWWVGLGISLEALGETAQASQAYQQAASAGHLEPPVQQFLRGKVAALGLASR